jgi:hypothetical protein
MAEWLAPLSAHPSGPVSVSVLMISVEKLALFCNPASGGTLQALLLHCIVGYKFAVAKAKVFPHLEA